MSKYRRVKRVVAGTRYHVRRKVAESRIEGGCNFPGQIVVLGQDRVRNERAGNERG